MAALRVTFLGTGTSHGIPRIACECRVCRSTDPRNRRLRPSILVEQGDASILVDATPDFRQQALRADLRRVTAVLLTHAHADHVLGLDDLRVFTSKAPVTIHGSAATLADIGRIFGYACTQQPAYPEMPHFALRAVAPGEEVRFGELAVRAVSLWHGRLPVLGYVFGGQVAYLTDCSGVPAETVATLRGIKVLVIDGLRHRPHLTHLTVAQAIEVAQRIQPTQTLLTHICHDLDHAEAEAALPAGVRLAVDGMRIEVNGEDWRVVP